MSAIRTVAIAGPGGARARVLSYGARLQAFEVPDRDGALDSIVLGYPDPESYRRDTAFIGGVIGRYANRIAGARFVLDGRMIAMPANDGANHLHGGLEGFDRRDWTITDADSRSVRLGLVSEDGDQGYPGRLAVTALYAFDDDDALTITLEAATDAPTIVNLSHHAYFNLAGQRRGGSIAGHWLRIAASCFTPTDAEAIPTGEVRDVTGTAFDFRTPHRVGARWSSDDRQLVQAGGYDHNYVIDGREGAFRRIATLYDPGSGRLLDLSSTAPGLQFYSGNALSSGDPGLGGRAYAAREGLCLEPQHFPDSPNRPAFPSARLAPGEVYRHQIRLAPGTAGTAEAAFAR
ncbi:MAG TPA: aldose epimerase family protein [Sphingomonas sp.]|nr:aldose epimerase family protein [Sphingomonas sp.]